MLELGRALTLAGRARAELGEREAAREALEKAARILQEHRAERMRDAAERELRRLGYRIYRRSQPAPPAGAGVESLTKREHPQHLRQSRR